MLNPLESGVSVTVLKKSVMHSKENYCLSFDSLSLIKIRSHHFCKQKATNLFVLFGKRYSLKFHPVFKFITLGGALNLSLN